MLTISSLPIFTGSLKSDFVNLTTEPVSKTHNNKNAGPNVKTERSWMKPILDPKSCHNETHIKKTKDLCSILIRLPWTYSPSGMKKLFHAWDRGMKCNKILVQWLGVSFPKETWNLTLLLESNIHVIKPSKNISKPSRWVKQTSSVEGSLIWLEIQATYIMDLVG